MNLRIEDVIIDKNNDIIDNSSLCTTTKKLIDVMAYIVKGKRTMEILAGNGYLCGMLKKRLVEIGEDPDLLTAYDNGDWGFVTEKWYFNDKPCVTTTNDVDVSSADIVILSWPPYSNNKAFDYLNDMRSGAMLLYCGTNRSEYDDYLKKNFVELESNRPTLRALQRSYKTWNDLQDNWRICIKS